MWFKDPETGKVTKVHYKRNRDGQDVDWEAIARAAGAAPELIAEFTKTKPGARPLKLGKED